MRKCDTTLMLVNYEAAVRGRLQFGQRGILLGLDKKKKNISTRPIIVLFKVLIQPFNWFKLG